MDLSHRSAVWAPHPRSVTLPRRLGKHPTTHGVTELCPHTPGAGARAPGRCGEGPGEAPGPLRIRPGALGGKPGERRSVERRLCPGRSGLGVRFLAYNSQISRSPSCQQLLRPVTEALGML